MPCNNCTAAMTATTAGWVCPNGCPDYLAGRRYRGLDGGDPGEAFVPAPEPDLEPSNVVAMRRRK